MNGVALSPLTEKAEVVRGVTFSKGDAVAEPREGYTPVLRAGNIQSHLILDSDLVYIPEEMVSEKQRLRRGDIVMCTSSGSAEIVGKTAFADQDWIGSFGAFCAVVRPKLGKCHPRYLFHYLQTPRFREWTRNSSGVGIKNIRKSELDSYEVPFPSLDEQRRIAATLDKADAIRRKRKQALTMADDFLRSVFLEMFGDPASNSRGWPITLLDELGDVQGGLQVSSKREAGVLTLPYLRVANVYRDRLELAEIKEINLTEAEFRRVRLQVGDILIVEGHGNPEEIGRSAIWDGSIEPCVHQNHLIRFRADRSRALPEYISRLLNSDGGRQQLIGAGRTTSGLNTISTRKVKEVRIPLPPVTLQQKFSEVVKARLSTTEKLLTQLELSRSLISSLSHRAFRGEL